VTPPQVATVITVAGLPFLLLTAAARYCEDFKLLSFLESVFDLLDALDLVWEVLSILWHVLSFLFELLSLLG
jgi:hypothetical protein